MMKKMLLLVLSLGLGLNGYHSESGYFRQVMGYTSDVINQEAPSAVVSDTGKKCHPHYIAGIWQNSPWLGAGFSDVYWFEKNGVFTWSNSDAVGAERLRYTTGEWYVEDDILYLSASALVVRQGGVEIPGYASMVNDRIGGELVRIDLAPENRAVEAYPLAPLDDAFFSGFQMGSIRLYGVAADWGEKKTQLTAVRDNDPSFLEQKNNVIKERETERKKNDLRAY